MKISMYVVAFVMLFIPNPLVAGGQPTVEDIQQDLVTQSEIILKREKSLKVKKGDAQALVDQIVPGGVPPGKTIVVKDKVKTKFTTAGVKQITEQSIEVTDIIPYDPKLVRLGTTLKNTNDYKVVGYQFQQQMKGLYNVELKPEKSSAINLAGIRDGQLDWAIITIDTLLLYPDLEIEVLAELEPKYAHLVLRRMNNSSIEDLDDLDGNDMMAIGDEFDDSHTTWTILTTNFSQYSLIPTVKHAGYRALSSTRMGLVQGYFRVCNKQEAVILKSNTDPSLKMIHINNDRIYGLSARGYKLYAPVTFKSDMYDSLISSYLISRADTMEIKVLLVSSKAWFEKHKSEYDNMYPRIEKAIANSSRGVRAY